MKRGWIIAGSVAAVLLIAAFAYIRMRYANYNTPPGAMPPTLRTGAAFFVDRFAYRNDAPRRGDIVVFVPPILSKNPFIKRIVAVPGDRFVIRAGHAVLNGRRVDEPYVAENTDYD